MGSSESRDRPEDARPALLERSTSPGPSATRQRVLIIEDNRDAAESLSRFLTMSGHEVALAFTGPEGVRAAMQWLPEVVLCDIGLPDLDGFGVARELREMPDTAKARLIAITGYDGEEYRRRGQQMGFDHYFVKPADPEMLLELLAPPR